MPLNEGWDTAKMFRYDGGAGQPEFKYCSKKIRVNFEILQKPIFSIKKVFKYPYKLRKVKCLSGAV